MEEINLEDLLEREDITVEQICDLVNNGNISKSSIVNNEKFKEKLYNELQNTNFSYSCIKNVVSTLGIEECIENLDIDKLMESNNSYRFFVTLLEKNSKLVLNKVANDEKYYKHFFAKVDDFYSAIDNPDYEDIRSIVKRVNNTNQEPANFRDFLKSISSEDSEKLLKEELNDNLVVSIVKTSSKDLKQHFINKDPRALHLYKELGILKMINEGIQFPKDILRQNDFFEALKGKDLVEFRRNINRLYKNNYSSEIQRKVEKYHESIIKDFNPEKNIFNSYDISTREQLHDLDMTKEDYILDGNVRYEMHKNIEDKDKLQEELQKATNNKLSEVIIDSLFSDTKNNVKININEMLRYNNHLSDDKKVLNEEKVEFYDVIKNIDRLPNDKKIEMYNQLKNGKVMENMYNDISALRELSYEEINKSLFKTQDNPEEISLSETDKNDVEVYKLTGKPFNMLVRAMNNNYREESHNVQSSYSLISGNNTKVFSELGFIYGYDSLDPESVLNVFESDSYTFNLEDNVTERPNRIMTPEEITDSDSGYSEINIKNKENENYDGKNNMKKYKEMKPSYLVCMDRITEEQVQESKRLGIPLVVIERERYKNKQIEQVEYEKYDPDIN